MFTKAEQFVLLKTQEIEVILIYKNKLNVVRATMCIIIFVY